jgi:flagellum-specific peptidoglycan hydrolase FlgJ
MTMLSFKNSYVDIWKGTYNMATIPIEVVLAAQSAMKVYGVPASVTIAQWILESAWGEHMPPRSNNPFGIKSTQNQPYVTAITHEYIHGRYLTTEAKFRRFTSISEAFSEHARLIATRKVYLGAMAKKKSPAAFARALTGIYATDRKYGDKLVSIMQTHNLYQYDIWGE